MVRKRIGLAVTATVAMGASPADAYLYWTRPALAGAPTNGDEPGITLPLPGATAREMKANLLWSMRAGLNVAALQCQFAPALNTVANYNALIKQHAAELLGAMNILTGYFKRTGAKSGNFDQYTTRTYNGFSTMHAQLSFCETAASIGRDALDHRIGQLGEVAVARMREFRNSLTPIGDAAFAVTPDRMAPRLPAPELGPLPCYDRKGREKACKS